MTADPTSTGTRALPSGQRGRGNTTLRIPQRVDVRYEGLVDHVEQVRTRLGLRSHADAFVHSLILVISGQTIDEYARRTTSRARELEQRVNLLHTRLRSKRELVCELRRRLKKIQTERPDSAMTHHIEESLNRETELYYALLGDQAEAVTSLAAFLADPHIQSPTATAET